MTVGRDLRHRCRQRLRQVGRAGFAEGAVLNVYEAAATTKRRRACCCQRIGDGLQVLAVKPLQVEALPRGVQHLMLQGVHSGLQGGEVIAPVEMDGHGVFLEQ